MATPPEKPKPKIDPLQEDEIFQFDEDEYKIAVQPVEPRALPEYVARQLRAAEQKRVSAAEELPPPPRWPMLSGILLFPFYLKSLEVLVFTTFGLMVSGWLLMFWIAYGAFGGPQPPIILGVGVCCSAYAHACVYCHAVA